MPILDVGLPPGSPDPSMGVCSSWATAADLCTPCLEKIAEFDAGVIDDALLAASEILYNLTLQQWPGECLKVLRPTARFDSLDTMRVAHDWPRGRGWSSCSCTSRDVYQVGCNYLSQITLGEVPIVEVVEVRIDGDVVDPARYRVDDYRWLVWLPDQSGVDERQGWPCCQRMELPTSEDDTFEVTVVVGSIPSRAGVRAAASLACQFMLAWTPGLVGQCKLPKRVTSMSRQQVSMNLTDPVAMFDKGLTGISEVDVWVQSVLKAHRSRRAAVVIPERRRQKVRRTTS